MSNADPIPNLARSADSFSFHSTEIISKLPCNKTEQYGVLRFLLTSKFSPEFDEYFRTVCDKFGTYFKILQKKLTNNKRKN